MKTKSFLLGAAALMLAASCSNDEVVNVAPQSGAIGFSSFVNNSTRGNDLAYADLNDLKVWGVTSRAADADGNGAVAATELFDGLIVNRDGAEVGTPWTYSPLRYWVAGNAYSFAAVAPYNATENGLSFSQTPSNDVDSEAGLTLTFDNSTAQANYDVLYATAKVETAGATQDAVDLNLKHMLSRVKFNFVNEWPGDDEIVIKDVKITNATKIATITKAGATGTWTEPEEATNNTFEVSFQVKTAVGQNIPTDHMYLIPLSDPVKLNLSFVIERKKGNDVIATYNHKNVPLYAADSEGFKLVNNCSYTFSAKIDEKTIDPNNEELNPIKFTAQVTAWDEFTNSDVTLPKNPTEGGNSTEGGNPDTPEVGA